jgi:hypothetical protein
MMSIRRRRVLTACEKQHRSIWNWGLFFSALLLSILMFSCDAQADTQTWDVTVTCDAGAPFYVCSEPFNLDAVVTTQPETGTFFDGTFQGTVTGTVPVVIGATGTFNGAPFSFTAPPYDFSGGQWLNPYPENVSLGVAFFFQVFDDTFTQAGPEGIEQVFWSAQLVSDPPPASVPEPITGLLAGVGFALLVIRRKMS